MADVNHDGIPDVLTVDGGALVVYLGKGDGTFTQLPPNFSQSVQFVDDFNGDGKPDILWRSSSGLTVNVALGNGDGTFQNPALVSGLSGRIAAVADFNNDGKLDLGVVVPTCNGVYCTFAFGVQPGNGDGTFQSIGPQIAIPPHNDLYPYSVGIAVGDLNGDGRMDVVYAIDFNQIVGTLIGNGDGTFTYGSSYGVGNGGGPNGIAVADLNGDHKLDIVEGQLPGLLLSVLIGHGDGTFAAAPALEVTPNVGIPVAADFNGDGKPDLAILSDSAIAIFLDTPNGLMQTRNFSTGLTETGFFAAADLTHGGKQDLLIGVPGNIVVFIGNGDGTFESPSRLPGCGGTNATVQGLGDFNGDHLPDVIATDGALLYICLGKGDGTFGPSTQYLAGSGPGQVAIGDFNGDGNLDVAVASPTEIGLLLGNGNGTFQPVTIPISYANDNIVYNLAAADVNLDGKLDIIVIENTGFSATVLQISLGNGDGTFRTLSAQNLGSSYGPIAVSDLNGDGKPDLLISGSFYPGLCLGHGDGTFNCGPFAYAYGGGTIADFNGDGRPDIASITSYDLVVLLNATAQNFTISASGLSPSPVAPGSSVTSTVAIGPIFGFNQTVTLSCGSLPAGVTCSFNPPSVLNASGNSTLTVNVADTVQPGAYSLPVSGTAGAIVNPTTVQLSVGSFTVSASGLSPSPTSPGSKATSTVTIAPLGGFTGTVTLSCSNLPAGVTCSFNPPSVPNASGSSVLTVDVADSAQPGTYSLSVTGTSGSLVQPTTLQLNVAGFTMSAAALSPAAVSAGGSATSTITLTSKGSFSASVKLSCSSITLNGSSATSAPPTCSFNPATLTSGSGTSTLTVSTTGVTAMLSPRRVRDFGLSYGLWLPMCGIALIGAGTASRKRKVLTLLMVLALGCLITLPACGGGGGSGGGGGGGSGGTPAGTYTVTVMASASGFQPQTTTVTLSVK